MAPLLARCPGDTYRAMGLPEALHASVRARIPGLAETVLGRLDLVRTPRGYALLEFNTDVPGLFVEAFDVNRIVCMDARMPDANHGCESQLAHGLESAIAFALDHLGLGSNARRPRVAFAAAQGSLRDLDLARYLAGLAHLPSDAGAQVPPGAAAVEVDTGVCAIEDLQADGDGLYASDGARIDVLFRLCPLLAFPFKRLRGAGGACGSTWIHLLDLVERRRLVLINPPSAGLLNSKAVQAVIWNLHRSGQFFDPAEHALVEQHVLPSYLDPVFGDAPHVVKPACGRGGDTVRIVRGRQPASGQAAGTSYAGQPMVYQQYAPLPTARWMTEDGRRRLHVVASCFAVNWEPAGICLRAGGPVTDESAWHVPMSVARTDSTARLARGTSDHFSVPVRAM